MQQQTRRKPPANALIHHQHEHSGIFLSLCLFDSFFLFFHICKCGSSVDMLASKDDEIKELKNEIEKLTSEVEMFKSLKIYMEENKEKRQSTMIKSRCEKK